MADDPKVVGLSTRRAPDKMYTVSATFNDGETYEWHGIKDFAFHPDGGGMMFLSRAPLQDETLTPSIVVNLNETMFVDIILDAREYEFVEGQEEDA